jgi:hypothetical protein
MAYDDYLAERVKQNLTERKVNFNTLKMMGGLCFMVNDKMCIGVLKSKIDQQDLLMARIGTAAYLKALSHPACLPMDFTGRPMKGYVFVTPDGFDLDKDLDHWIQLSLDFNPLAKASKKRKK